MDGAIVRQLATESIEAFNRADWNRVREHLAPGFVYEEPGTGRRFDGPDAMVAALQVGRVGVPDLYGEVVHAVVDGDDAVLEIVWRGTHNGPMDTPAGVLPATGRSFEMWATMWQRWDGDLLVHERHHHAVLSLLAQLGALPAPAGA